MKNHLFLLLALVASTTLSYAGIVEGTCGDNLTWSLNTKDSTLTIEGSGAMHDWSMVSAVPWDNYRSYIQHINLPYGLTSIGDHAFVSCFHLVSIEIPSNVTSIGYNAFNHCSLTSVTIPNSVSSIGPGAFAQCNLTSVTIPSSVTSIGDWAFESCHKLTSVTIPYSVTNIGKGTFRNCISLKSMTIPNSVNSIGDEAFEECPITSLTVLATTPPSGGVSCGIIASICTLYVPAEAVEIYANTVWWEDFMQIKATEGNLFTVNFVDWNGQLLARRFVKSGNAAVAPTAPTREGYTFIGWDIDFSDVTSDMTVTALYKEWTPVNYNFVFLNGTDNSLIGTKQVDFTFPTPPDVSGFSFLKWFVVAGDVENKIVFIAVYEYNGVPAVQPNEVSVPGNSNQKLIREGNVYILTDDSNSYIMTGQKVR